TVLPRYLLSRFLSDNSSGLKKLAGNWKTALPFLQELHAKLGGDAKTFACVASAIEDPTRHSSFDLDKAAPQRFHAVTSALARRIDPSPEFTAFADWLDGAIGGNTEPPTALDRMGPWARLCFCWSSTLSSPEKKDPTWERVQRDVIERSRRRPA